MFTRNKRNSLIILSLFGVAAIYLAITLYSDRSLPALYFFWKPAFLLFIKVSCVVLFVLLAFKLYSRNFFFLPWLKLIGGVIFLPVLLFPVFRCYFKVPYVFCRACYDKCPWGLSRTVLLSTFITLNLSGRFWCTAVCPFGSLQESLAQFSNARPRLGRALSVSAYIVLFIIAWLYIMTLRGSSLNFFEAGLYAWSTVSAVTAGAIVITAGFIVRFWCRSFCPVGTLAQTIENIRSFSKSFFKK